MIDSYAQYRGGDIAFIIIVLLLRSLVTIFCVNPLIEETAMK